MAVRRRTPGRRRGGQVPVRYTVDASVFVDAFNTRERGHAESLAALTAMHERGDPVILPSLALPEIASAIARSTDDEDGAIRFARAIAALPHVTIVPLAAALALDAADLAAGFRLRGADAVYASVARRYATTLITRDDQQRARASAAVPCETPEEMLQRI
jgi:predicted nucleic acid-binding protein